MRQFCSSLLLLIALFIVDETNITWANSTENATFDQLLVKAEKSEEAGDIDGATKILGICDKLRPNSKEVAHQRAKVAADAGQLEKAEQEFEKALRADPGFVECRNDYGLFLLRFRDAKLALVQWDKCIQADARFPYSYFNRGMLLHDQGKLDEAIESFEKVSALSPNFAHGHRELGLCYFEKANLEASIQQLRIATSLAPDDARSHYYLGFFSTEANKVDEARKEFILAISTDNNLAAAHWELARLLYQMGNYKSALAELTSVMEVDPRYTANYKLPAIKVEDVKKLMDLCLEAMETAGSRPCPTTTRGK